MAKKASPWFWEQRNGWYVLVSGRRHFLGEHPAGAPKPHKSKKTGKWNSPPEIDEAFRALLGGSSPRQAPAAEDAVVNVLDDFLTWCKENRAQRTAERYQDFIQDFVKAADGGIKFGSLGIHQLSSRHVTAWLGQHPTWNSTTKKNAITALQRGFNWACKNRGLKENPIRGMEKPEAKRRDSVVAPVEFHTVLEHVPDERFKDLLVVSYDSGCRPQEVKQLEARHVQLDKARAVLPADEAKGGIVRAIYFPTDRSQAIIRRLCETHPTGPLFRNRRGNRWTGMAVKCRFEDVEVAIGVAEMKKRGVVSAVTDEAVAAFAATLSPTRKDRKTGAAKPKTQAEIWHEAREKLVAREARQFGKRFKHYDFRRTFITRKIIAGVDSHVVAKLSGHQSTAMIDKHYSAVANDHEFLLQQAARDVDPGATKKGPEGPGAQDKTSVNPGSGS